MLFCFPFSATLWGFGFPHGLSCLIRAPGASNSAPRPAAQGFCLCFFSSFFSPGRYFLAFVMVDIQAGSAFPDQEFTDLAKSCNAPTAVIDALAAEWNIALFAFICTDVNDLAYTLTEAGVPEGELQANRTIASLRLCKASVAPGAPSAHSFWGLPCFGHGGMLFHRSWGIQWSKVCGTLLSRPIGITGRRLFSCPAPFIPWRLRLSQRMEDDWSAPRRWNCIDLGPFRWTPNFTFTGCAPLARGSVLFCFNERGRHAFLPG